MRLLILASLLSTAAFSAPPVVSTPASVDPAVISPSRNGNGLAFAQGVSGGGVSLVVWVDTRVPSGGRRVWATRLDALGQPLDKPMLEVGDSYGVSDSHRPRAAFDGTNFVVVWIDASQRTVSYRRVSPQGALVDAAPRVAVTSTTATYNGTNVVSDGAGTTLITWVKTTGPGAATVEAKRFDATGAALDATALSVSPTPSGLRSGAVFDGTQFMLTFLTGANNAYTLSARRISLAGALGTLTNFFTLGANYATTTMACATAGCLLAWPSGTQVLGARFANGALVDTSPLTLFSRASRPMALANLAFDGTRYWLTADATGPSSFDDTGVAVRLDTSAAPLGTTDFPDAWDPSGFVGPTGTFFALRGGRLLVTRVDSAGTLLDMPEIQIDYAANDQREGRIAIAGGVVLAAWRDSREPTDVVMARRFDLSGMPLDPQSLRLGAFANQFSSGMVDVVFDGQSFVVGWRDGARVHLSRVSPAGVALDPPGGVVVSPDNADHIRMVSDGQVTFVVWQGRPSTSLDVLGVRFSRAGVVLDAPPVVLASASGDESSPSLCFDGTNVWAGWLATQFRVTRLSATGAVLDPAGIPLVGPGQSAELVSGTPCVTAWTDGVGIPRASRFAADGGLDGASGLSSLRAANTPSMTWNGAFYMAAVTQSPTQGFSLVRWLNGQLIDPTNAVSIATPGGNPSVDTASNGAGTSFVIHQTWDSRPAFSAHRVFLTSVLDLLDGQACSAGNVCHSGLCVDGVCCNSACAGGTNDCQACSVSAGAAVDGVCGPTTGNGCSDQSACTQTDACLAGACQGMNPVSCPAPGECELTNLCVAATGACQVQRRADGAACSAGECRAGACVAIPDAGSGGGAGGGGGTATGGGSATGGGGAATGGGSGTGGGFVATGGGGGGGGSGTPTGCGCTSGFEVFALLALALLRKRR